MRIMARSSSKRNAASARANSVLPTPVGPRKDERANRSMRVLEARARPHHRIGHRGDRFILADDALVQFIAQVQQLLHLAFEQLDDWNSRPSADHLGDVFLIDLFFNKPIGALLGSQRLLLHLEVALRARPICRT